jgi:hypothetical protein
LVWLSSSAVTWSVRDRAACRCPAEQVDSGPDAGFQPERRAACHGQFGGLVDQRVLFLSRPSPGQPEECLEQLCAMVAVRLARREFI